MEGTLYLVTVSHGCRFDNAVLRARDTFKGVRFDAFLNDSLGLGYVRQ